MHIACADAYSGPRSEGLNSSQRCNQESTRTLAMRGKGKATRVRRPAEDSNTGVSRCPRLPYRNEEGTWDSGAVCLRCHLMPLTSKLTAYSESGMGSQDSFALVTPLSFPTGGNSEKTRCESAARWRGLARSADRAQQRNVPVGPCTSNLPVRLVRQCDVPSTYCQVTAAPKVIRDEPGISALGM
jgi:hypothetical protein